MKLFECQNCGQLVYFENALCERCGMSLGYDHSRQTMVSLNTRNDGGFEAFDAREPDQVFYYCANHAAINCNWLVRDNPNNLCLACNLNKVIPNLDLKENVEHWSRIEIAKRRLIYSLERLKLPIENKLQNPEGGLEFNFLAADHTNEQAPPVLTGHDHGEIVLNVDEADDVHRATVRQAMNEPYRTLLGHFRHEIAHYYFERIVQNSPYLIEFHKVFGNETADYGAALKAHYADGAPADWQTHFITAYASAHPHEDWAETFAHHLHMIDTLETAYAFGLRVKPRVGQDDNLKAAITFDPYLESDFSVILDAWLPLTFAVNSLNRSMGLDDLYPFVISPEVSEKLAMVHKILKSINPETESRNFFQSIIAKTFG